MKTCIFLSKPRSGATVFRHALNTHEAVFDFGEIFNESNGESYFHFSAGKIAEDRTWLFPSRSTELFELYIGHCHELAAKWKPRAEVALFDVKYDHLHFVYRSWQMFGAQPVLFDLIRKNDWRLINLRRLNVLDAIISNALAMRDQIYHLENGAPATKRETIHLDVQTTFADCQSFIAESAGIAKYFADYPNCLELTYDTLFAENGEEFAPKPLEEVAGLMGIPNQFNLVPALIKVVKGEPLDYVENRAEIVSEIVSKLARPDQRQHSAGG